MNSNSLTVMPCGSAATEFLAQLYFEIHQPEFAALGLREDTLVQLLRQQSAAQEASYKQRFPDAERHLIQRDGTLVGRMIVDHQPDHLHLVDIAVLPAYQRQGFGTACLQRILASANGRPVRLSVMFNNPARRLYTRLGFRVVSEVWPYLTMECGIPGSSGDESGRGAVGPPPSPFPSL